MTTRQTTRPVTRSTTRQTVRPEGIVSPGPPPDPATIQDRANADILDRVGNTILSRG